ncbi:MAG: OprO/OprP family phosphate-selective porin [Planctomycetes bacterium]|nr:OprO/OprP family phosphate-selective porin [Planctomycetota bacterium]
MSRRNLVVAGIAVAFALSGAVWAADEELRRELDRVKKELEDMRSVKGELAKLKRQQGLANAPIGSADAIVENKYGPNAGVTTKQGKLTIGGLVQVWYYTIQNDNLGLFDDITPGENGGGDSNETKDNDGFRIRRTELKFTIDIHENVTVVVMIDPARETGGAPSFSSNLGTNLRGRTGDQTSFNSNGTMANSSFQTGAGSSQPKLLQDAYVHFHGFVPHHDFQIGQFKPQVGEEGIRSSSALDFVERSMLGQLGDKRDLGMTAHGTWWSDRFQYWLGLWNSAGNFHGSGGDQQNRTDDNDALDFAARILLRPLWKDETWGSIELGASTQFGEHGEAGDQRALGEGDLGDDTTTVDGLNRRRTWAMRHGAWLHYFPGGPVKGWWLKGEWAWMKDRNIPEAVRGFEDGFQGGSDFLQSAPNPFSVQGFYFATGYKISDSIWSDKVPGWFKPFEFAFRYDYFQNITVGDLVRPEERTDVFATTVYTAGINYYIKGNNAKIQMNYNWSDEPQDDNNTPARHLREVRNDSFVVNFQVAW